MRNSAAMDGHLRKRRRLAHEFGLMKNGVNKRTPRFVGSSSGIHFIKTVYATLAKSAGSPLETQDSVPGEDDELEPQTPRASPSTPQGASPSFWSPSEVLHTEDPEANQPEVTFEKLVEWTRNYFVLWHPFFPFLNAPVVLGLFETVSQQGIDQLSAHQAAIVRALISISLADARQSTRTSDPIPEDLTFKDGDDLTKNLQFAFSHATSLENLQACIAVQLYLISMLKFNSASRLGGCILRMAFQLGLHRCPARYANISKGEATMRQRIFWTAYILERVLCQSLGLPLDIHDDDIDTCYPGEEMHIENRKGEESTSSQLRLLVVVAKHSRIRGLILELRNKSLTVRNDSLDKTIAVHAELSKWINETQEIIELINVNPASTVDDRVLTPKAISTAQSLIIQLMQHESVLALNRPGVTANAGTPAGVAALQNCISASRSIISLLDAYITENTPSTDTWRMDVPLPWPLLTWSVWMSCFVLVYAALEGHTTLNSAFTHAIKTEKILKHLSLRQTTWPDSCAEAVRHLVAALSAKCDKKADKDTIQKASRATSDKAEAVHTKITTAEHVAQSSSRRHRQSYQAGLQHRRSGSGRSKGSGETEPPNSAPPVGHTAPTQMATTASDQSSPVNPQPADAADLLTSEQSPDYFDLEAFDPFTAIDFSTFLGSTSMYSVNGLFPPF